MGWAGKWQACERRKLYKWFWWKNQEERGDSGNLGELEEDNIEMDLKEMGWCVRVWNLVEDREKWQDLVSRRWNLRVPQIAGYFFTTPAAVSFLRGTRLNDNDLVLATTTSNGGVTVSVTVTVFCCYWFLVKVAEICKFWRRKIERPYETKFIFIFRLSVRRFTLLYLFFFGIIGQIRVFG